MTRDKKHPETRKIALSFDNEAGKPVKVSLKLQGRFHFVSELQHAEGFKKLPIDVQNLIIGATRLLIKQPEAGSVSLPIQGQQQQTRCSA